MKARITGAMVSAGLMTVVPQDPVVTDAPW
jgi:hypothetical protein